MPGCKNHTKFTSALKNFNWLAYPHKQHNFKYLSSALRIILKSVVRNATAEDLRITKHWRKIELQCLDKKSATQAWHARVCIIHKHICVSVSINMYIRMFICMYVYLCALYLYIFGYTRVYKIYICIDMCIYIHVCECKDMSLQFSHSFLVMLVK